MGVSVLRSYGLVDFEGALNSESRYLGFVDGRRTLK